MTFQPPATRQDQSRKVLEEIQMQKKLLKQGAAVSLNPIPPSTLSSSTPPVTANSPTEPLNPSQRQALQLAQTSSFGFFVTQDSSFGNFILPAIPRLEPSK